MSEVGELFNHIVKFVLKIDPPRRHLAIKFLDNYYFSRNYRKYGARAWGQIKIITNKYKNILILPVVAVDDVENSSGQVAVYELMNYHNAKIPNNILQRKDPFKEAACLKKCDYILYVDDFVGSGNQFIKMYNNTKKYIGNRKVGLYSFVIQELGLDAIIKTGVELYYHTMRKRAISDGFGIGDLDPHQAMADYMAIEALVEVPKGRTLGDRQMEALVTMKRTPNSTLPIFWCTGAKGGGQWPAPFIRT